LAMLSSSVGTMTSKIELKRLNKSRERERERPTQRQNDRKSYSEKKRRTE